VILCAVGLSLAAAAIVGWQLKSVDLPLVGKASSFSNPFLTKASADTPREEKSFGLGFYPPSATELPISVMGGYCVGAKAKTMTRVQRVEVDESEHAVTLHPYVVEPEVSGGDCAGVGYEAYGSAKLSEPIGDRAVLDDKGHAVAGPTILRTDRLQPGTVPCPSNGRLYRKEIAHIRAAGVRCTVAARAIGELKAGRSGSFTCDAVGDVERSVTILCRRSYSRAFDFDLHG
jgi:hypothetical protein